MTSVAQASSSKTKLDAAPAVAQPHGQHTNGHAPQERPRKRQRSQEPAESQDLPQPQPQQSIPTPFEPSFFGIAPHDQIVKQVGQQIWTLARNRRNVEIEAKIGILLDHRKGVQEGFRLRYPFLTEALLTGDASVRFNSDMSAMQHRHFDDIFTQQLHYSHTPEYTGSKIFTRHTRETDYTHPDPDKGWGSKLRVTKEHPDKHNLRFSVLKGPPDGMVRKTRLGNMNVFSAGEHFDYRISVNTETPLNFMPTGQPESARYKDRISFEHQFLRIDLTQVTTDGHVTHELEVEIKDVDMLMAEGAKEFAEPPQDNRYYEMLGVFLSTVRMIIKNCIAP